MSALRYRYPECYVAGVESFVDVACLGRYMGDITAGNLEETTLPFPDHSFDIICIYDALKHARDKEELFMKLIRLLKNDGYLIVSKGSEEGIPKSVNTILI